MRNRIQATAVIIVLMLGACKSDLLQSHSEAFVSSMKNVFVIRDGSNIVDPSDPFALTAIRDQATILLQNYSRMASMQDLRDPEILNDEALIDILMLAIMGNFHRHTLSSASVFDDVQIVYDPIQHRFITTQNLRQTEITIFQALLIISVIGLSTMFMMNQDRGDKESVTVTTTTSSQLYHGVHPVKIRMPF